MKFSKIYENTKAITSDMEYINGNLLLFSDKNSISILSSLPKNPFGFGYKNIYSETLCGDGNLSSSIPLSVLFGIYGGIIKTFGDSFIMASSGKKLFGTTVPSSILSTYISDVLFVDEDFGYWKTASWKQSSGKNIVVSFKVSNNSFDIDSKDWEYRVCNSFVGNYGYVSDSSNVVVPLDRFNLKGRYMKFKVDIEWNGSDIIPYISDFVISYSSKTSVYFFSRKFKLDSGSTLDGLLMSSNYYVPQNTEIKFGVTTSGSSNWKDYKIVDFDRLLSLGGNYSGVKVGIKMSSFDKNNYPTVQDISFMLNSTGDTKINSQ